MFIKWRHEWKRGGFRRWYAYLAKSKRINKQPRQEIILYLASISVKEDGIANPCDRATLRFWFDVLRSLALADTSTRDAQEVIRLVKDRIPFPGEEEWDLHFSDVYEDWKIDHRYNVRKLRVTEHAVRQYFMSYLWFD